VTVTRLPAALPEKRLVNYFLGYSMLLSELGTQLSKQAGSPVSTSSITSLSTRKGGKLLLAYMFKWDVHTLGNTKMLRRLSICHRVEVA